MSATEVSIILSNFKSHYKSRRAGGLEVRPDLVTRGVLAGVLELSRPNGVEAV